MSENDDYMLIEEIMCCKTEEDIQSLVDSQCLDIISDSLVDQLTLAHKQMFRVIRLFNKYLKLTPNQIQEQKKYRDQNTIQHHYCQFQHQYLNEKNKVKSYEIENNTLKTQIKLYEGDFETMRQQTFEDIKKLEDQLVKTQNSISLYKNSLIQKFCVICLQKEYCIVLKPCGHVCVCEDCSNHIDQCPVDRVKIQKMKRVYLS